MGIPILGIVENMSTYACPCCSEIYRLFSEDAAKSLADELGILFLGSLPLDQVIEGLFMALLLLLSI